ncbi:MAG: HD domain-containing protein, partial [Planctomycetota bacterium]
MAESLRPSNEALRLDALRSYEVLDTPPDSGLDDLVRLVAERFSTPTAVVCLVAADRVWFKARHGIDTCGGSRDEALANRAILDPEVMVVPDARADERFRDMRCVTGPLNVRFYAAAPLVTPEGFALGALSVLGPEPREMTDADRADLAAYARQAMSHLELHRRVADHERAQDDIEAYREALEVEVIRRTREISQTREEVVHCLARAAEYRDDNTGRHTRRVGAYVTVLAEAIGLRAGEAKAMGLAATLHDIGKIGVPDRIL